MTPLITPRSDPDWVNLGDISEEDPVMVSLPDSPGGFEDINHSLKNSPGNSPFINVTHINVTHEESSVSEEDPVIVSLPDSPGGFEDINHSLENSPGNSPFINVPNEERHVSEEDPVFINTRDLLPDENGGLSSPNFSLTPDFSAARVSRSAPNSPNRIRVDRLSGHRLSGNGSFCSLSSVSPPISSVGSPFSLDNIRRDSLDSVSVTGLPESDEYADVSDFEDTNSDFGGESVRRLSFSSESSELHEIAKNPSLEVPVLPYPVTLLKRIMSLFEQAVKNGLPVLGKSQMQVPHACSTSKNVVYTCQRNTTGGFSLAVDLVAFSIESVLESMFFVGREVFPDFV